MEPTGRDPEPRQYVIGRVRDVLAADPRGGELDVRVKVAGSAVYLTGTVATAGRRDAVGELVAELLPDYDLHNALDVVETVEDPTPEQLS